MFDKAFFKIESLKLDKQFLNIAFSEYGNITHCFFDITSNFLEKNIYANLLTRYDDACVITPYLFIYLSLPKIFCPFSPKFLTLSIFLASRH